MSERIDVTVACFTWHQFTIDGDYLTNDHGYSHWAYPDGFKHWLETALKGRYAYMRADRKVPIFIENKRDAMVFRLVWDKHL